MTKQTKDKELFQIFLRLEDASKSNVLRFARQELTRCSHAKNKEKNKVAEPERNSIDHLDINELALEYCQF